MKRILIVDDHPAVVRGLESILSGTFGEIHISIARDPDDAIDQFRNNHWDAVITDLNLPNRGGFELIRQMKEVKPKVPLLVYSMYSEEQFGVRAIQAGADGFVPKDAPVDEIPRALRILQEGRQYVREGLAGELVKLARAGNGGAPVLSDREEQVLRMLAAGKTPNQMADLLNVSVKSIATYRSRVLDKLGLQTTADAIRYALDHGYI